ncbi:MAG: hypothetical protein ACUZ8I_10755 [Candidatus Scalindua sp.]
MGVNRIFLGAFNAKVFGEVIIEKKNQAFDEILQEEHAKLMQLVSKMEKKWTIEQLYRKYNLMTKYHLPSGE